MRAPNGTWVESPDGALYNLAYAMSITLADDREGCNLVIRYPITCTSVAGGPDETEPYFDIAHVYDDRSRAEEDLALIRAGLKPVIRLGARRL